MKGLSLGLPLIAAFSLGFLGCSKGFRTGQGVQLDTHDPLRTASKVTTGSNLIDNPGFENDLTARETSSQASVTTSNVNSGSSALQLGPANNSGAGQDILGKLSSGKSYRLEVWAKLGGSDEVTWIGLKFINTSGGTVKDFWVQATSTSYTKYTIDFDYVSGAAKAHVWYWRNGGSSSSYADDFSVMELVDEQPSPSPSPSPTPGSTTTYYLSPSGDDNNDGSQAKPWKTLSRASSAALNPGDTLSLQGGASFNGTLKITRSGTESAPINITSHSTSAGERAEILAGNGEGLVVEDAQYIRISKLKITGSGITSNNGHGIKLDRKINGSARLKSVHIDQVETSGFRNTGIAFSATETVDQGWDDLRVTNADIHGNGYAGMWMGGCKGSSDGTYCFTNVYLGYSKIHDNPGIDIFEQTGNGVFFKDVDGGTIEHCVAYNNGELNKNFGGGPVGIWALFSKRVTIQFNESYNNKSKNADGGGFDLDGGMTNSIMQYNYSHDNNGAGYFIWEFHDVLQSKGNIVRYNISQNDSQAPHNGFYGGIHIGDTGGVTKISDLQIYGNTVYAGRGPGPAIVVEGNDYNIQVYNNVFMTTGSLAVRRGYGGENNTITFAGNAYHSTQGAPRFQWGATYDGLGNWRNATGQERLNSSNTGYQGDPQLIAPGQGGTLNDTSKLNTLTGYQLKDTSPVINLGVSLTSLGLNPGSRDFFGNAIPQGGQFDIGAHEFSGFR
jgi:Carbohydrate binding domain